MEACCSSPKRTASRESGEQSSPRRSSPRRSGSGSPGRGQSFSGLGRETSVAPGRKQASRRRELDVQPEPAAEEGVAPPEAGGNQAWILVSRPGAQGMSQSNFELRGIPMPVPGEGQVLLRSIFISVDPYMRGRMDDLEAMGKRSYFASSFALGEPPSGGVGSEVVESNHPDFSPGDVVTGSGPWQRFSVADGKSVSKCTNLERVPLEKQMSSANYSGLSSYLPIVHIGEPKAGETAYVSGAAGAVGSMACQILQKKFGCKVLGSVGSAEKVEYLRTLGIEAFNYNEKPVAEALPELCPDGVDIYFENVGGETLEATLENMNNHGRVIACGMISQYDLQFDERYGVKNLFYIVGKRLKMQGFIMSDWQGKERADAKAAVLDMIEKGEVQTTETIFEGFDKVPTAFCGLFTGANLGKALIRCSSQPRLSV